MMDKKKKKKLVLLGSGGHASVVASMANLLGLEINFVAVPSAKMMQSKISNVEYLLDKTLIKIPNKAGYLLLNGVGQKMGCDLRADIFLKFKEFNFKFHALIHPFSHVDPSSQISEGVQVMAGAIIQNDCFIGENSIVNTN